MKDINELARAGRLGADPSAGAVELIGGRDNLLPDELVENHLDADRKWRGGERGAPFAIPLNIKRILLLDPRQRGRFRYNEFERVVEIDGRRIEDTDETALMMWLYAVYRLKVEDTAVSKVVRLIAADMVYHPVREYLEGLRWDKKKRIGLFLRECFKVEGDPGGIYDAISAAWLVGCVARVMVPGCKLDTVAVLVGGQGRGKSRGLAAMMPDPGWFSDSAINLDSKDALMQLHSGVWLYEFAELADVGKKEAERVKAFISSRKDRFRLPYGRNVVEWDRCVVFAGTTNKKAGFLSDKTGSRRFWPCAVSDYVDVERIARERDQMWAEAVHAYRSGVQWYLTNEQQAELDKQSERFQETDSWAEAVSAWLDGGSIDEPGLTPGKRFGTSRVFDEVLRIPIERRHRGQEMRLSGVLQSLGCVRVGRGLAVNGRRVMLWEATKK